MLAKWSSLSTDNVRQHFQSPKYHVTAIVTANWLSNAHLQYTLTFLQKYYYKTVTKTQHYLTTVILQKKTQMFVKNLRT